MALVSFEEAIHTIYYPTIKNNFLILLLKYNIKT
jgi:hypothetical protein